MNREDYIKQKIRKNGYTVKSFATEIDMPYSTLLSILKGSLGGASVDNVTKICDGLGLTLDELNAVIDSNISYVSNDEMLIYEMINRIKQLKKTQQLTNEALSELAGIPKGTLAKILGNETKDPQISNIIKIGTALGVSIDYLIFGSNEETRCSDNPNLVSREMIADTLRQLREQSGLTADQVGVMVGKSGKTVNAWEHNRGQPDIEMLIKLCDIYGVDDFLAEFRGEQSDLLSLSDKEKNIILSYRSKSNMQCAIDTLLGVTKNI